jgi:FkbM family methyltransferase
MNPSARLASLRFAAVTARLGAGPTARLRLFLVTLLGNRRWPAGRSIRLRLRAMGRSFSCSIADYTQLLALREVFIDEDYRLDAGIAPRTIIDLGSNIGASLIYFRLRYPQARIVGFEPDPAVFARLQRNMAQFGGVEVHNVAVAGSRGEMTFFRYPQHSWASSLIPLWGTAADRLTVATRTLDDILDDVGEPTLDLLKMDIEGSEWDVLPGFRQLDKVKNFIGELHRVGDAPPAQLLDCLDDFRVSVPVASQAIVRFVATRD